MKRLLEVSISPHRELRLTAACTQAFQSAQEKQPTTAMTSSQSTAQPPPASRPAHNRKVPMKPFHQGILTSAPLYPDKQHFPPEMHLRLGWATQGLQLLTGTRSPKSNPGDTEQKVFFSRKAPQQQHVPWT